MAMVPAGATISIPVFSADGARISSLVGPALCSAMEREPWDLMECIQTVFATGSEGQFQNPATVNIARHRMERMQIDPGHAGRRTEKVADRPQA